MKTLHSISINGAVESEKPHDVWLDDFIDWVESRGESFGGLTSESDGDGPVGLRSQTNPQRSHKRKRLGNQ